MLCKDSNNNEKLIPLEYTSMNRAGEPGFLTETRCDFKYKDLLDLLEVISGIVVK